MNKFVILCVVASLAVSAQAGLTHLTPAIATYSAAAPSVSYSHFTSPAIATHAVAAPYATYSAPAIGTTHQSTVRSFDGTVTHHSKAVDTAFSSVRKSDTRVSNNVYAAAPAIATTYHAAAVGPALAYHAAAAPAIATTYHAAAAPAQILTPAAAHAVHYSSAPLVAHVSFDGLGTHYAF